MRGKKNESGNTDIQTLTFCEYEDMTIIYHDNPLHEEINFDRQMAVRVNRLSFQKVSL